MQYDNDYDMSMANVDLRGDRAYLAYHYDTGALGFEYVAATGMWTFRRTTLDFWSTGLAEDASDVGYTGNKDEAMTALLPKGFDTEKYPFVCKSIGIVSLGYPYTPTTSANDGTATFEVSPVGNILESAISRTPLLFQGSLQFADWEFLQDGRKCEAMLGPTDLLPGGFGADMKVAGPNGVAICTARVPLRRPIVIEPRANNSEGYIFRLNFRHTISVPRDLTFAAPNDGDNLALAIRLVMMGYVANPKNYAPLDEAEMAAATSA